MPSEGFGDVLHAPKENEGPLFEGMIAWINPMVGLERYTDIHTLLSSNGATMPTRYPEPPFDHTFLISPDAYIIPKEVTLVVTDYTDWGSQLNARLRKMCMEKNDGPIAEVTPLFVTTCVKYGKLYDPTRYSPDPTKFFSGIVITCSGLRVPDRTHLYGACVAFGGQYREALTLDVTHLVLVEPEGPKYQAATTHPTLRSAVTTVLPTWLDDCVRVRQLLPCAPYAVPGTAATESTHAAENRSTIPPLLPPLNFKPRSQFLKGRRVFLDPRSFPPDKPNVMSHLSHLVVSCGGELLPNLPTLPEPPTVPLSVPPPGVPHMAVLPHRDHPRAQLEALGCLAGSLDWMRDVVTSEHVTFPKDRVLHYPRPKGGVPGAAKLVIGITRYTGRAREDLKKMVEYIGARFTSALSASNTHCICAEPKGEKYTTGLDWNIELVNHRWLEDTLARLRVQPLSYPQYGVVGADARALESVVGRKEVEVVELQRSGRVTPPLPPDVDMGRSEVEVINVDANNGRTNGVRRPNGRSRAAESTSALAHSEADPIAADSTHTAAMKGSADIQQPLPQSPPASAPALPTEEPASVKHSPPRHLTSGASEVNSKTLPGPISQTASASRGTSKAQATSSRPVNGEAGSKAVALTKRRAGEDALPKQTKKQKQPLEKQVESGARTLKKSAYTSPAIAETGLRLSSNQWKKIYECGGTAAKNVNDATHLVAKGILRTDSLLTAICLCKRIVGLNWIHDSIAAGMWLDELAYIIRDPEMEVRLNFTIEGSISRAREKKLLTGKLVCVTANVHPDQMMLRRLVEYAGGEFIIKATARSIGDLPPGSIVLSCDQDRATWSHFTRRGFSVYSVDLLFDGLLLQELRMDAGEALLADAHGD